MSKKSKYEIKLKVKICKEYIGGAPANYLTQKYGIHHSLIYEWVRLYNNHGPSVFEKKKRNSTYSAEFKFQVIMECSEFPINLVAAKYAIRKSVVRNWIKRYNEDKVITPYDPKGDVYTMKSRKTSFEERLEIVEYTINNNYNYKESAEKFMVPYANIYSWVKKYLKDGAKSLSDSRGRPSQNLVRNPISEEEKKQILIETLQRRVKYLETSILVFKKKQEIQQRLMKTLRKRGNK